MASSSKTKILGLSLWNASDKPTRTDFRGDNEKLESLVGAHINNSNLHLTAVQKALAVRPHEVVQRTGSGTSSAQFVLSAPAALMLVLCEGHAPVEVDADGTKHVYWDFVSYWSGSLRQSFGGITMADTAVTVYSKTENGTVLHLNDSGEHYTIIILART